MGSEDPGEPMLDSGEAIEAADMYRRIVSIAHPGSRGWDWEGLGSAFSAGQIAMAVNWHEFAAGNEDSDIKGKVGYARLPRGPKRSASMYGGTGLGINATASERDQKAAWLFVNWATSKKIQLENLKSDVGGGTPTRDSVYKLPEVEKAKQPPSKMPNILTTDAVFEAWKPENIGLRPKIAGLERVRHGDLHRALEDARRPAGAGVLHAQLEGRVREGDRQRGLAAGGVMAAETVDAGRTRSVSRARGRFGSPSRGR